MVKPKTTLAAALAALFPNSEKAISEKLEQTEFDAFAGEVQEAQNRLDAQAEGNQAVADDLTAAKARITELEASLTTAQAALDKANSDLTAANTLNGELKEKAGQWDAYKASLGSTVPAGDSTNGKTSVTAGLSEKDQRHMDQMAELKAKYPGLMADIDVASQTED